MKKQQLLFVGITGIFFCLIIGIFVGRNLTGSYIPLDDAIHSSPTEASQCNQVNDGKININTATLQQLQLLPGIGEVTAQRILDYRNEHGHFSSIEELMNVSCIGEKKLEQIEPYLKIGGSHENSGS